MSRNGANEVGLRFAGLAHGLPSRVVTNAEVLSNLREQSAQHLSGQELDDLVVATSNALKAAGTTVRYHRAEGEQAYSICVKAGEQCLADAGMAPEDIDLLIYVGVGRGFLEPATANVFQDLLGLTNATCFDVLDACASWIRALGIARSFLLTGTYRSVMILNAEFMGRESHRYELRSIEEVAHWFPGVTIGEAATAVVLTLDGEPDGFQSSFRNWGSKRNLCLLPLPNVDDYLGGPAYGASPLEPLEFKSFGGPLLAFGATKLAAHFNALQAEGEWRYDKVFGHAASDGMSRHVAGLCGIDDDKFFFLHHRFGNVVSASVPLAMSLSKQAGELRDGDKILILVASAGVSTGVVRLTYRN